MEQSKERDAFEAWARAKGYSAEIGEYPEFDTLRLRSAWYAWQASDSQPRPMVADSTGEVRDWVSDLRRAHEYLDEGKPFFTGKDCSELADFIEQLAAPAPTASPAALTYRHKFTGEVRTFDPMEEGQSESWLQISVPASVAIAYNALCEERSAYPDPIAHVNEAIEALEREFPALTGLAAQPPAAAEAEKCPNCHGEGMDGEPGDEPGTGHTWKCQECDGTGRVQYRTVPVNPTRAMIDAAYVHPERMPEGAKRSMADCIRRAILAAPQIAAMSAGTAPKGEGNG